MAILLGKTSQICLNCMLKKHHPTRFMPDVLLTYTNNRIINGIKTGKIQEYKIIRGIRGSGWELIAGFKEFPSYDRKIYSSDRKNLEEK